MSIADYKRPKTEKLCPFKCQSMFFVIYSDETVKYNVYGKISKISDLIHDYQEKIFHQFRKKLKRLTKKLSLLD